MKYQRRMFGINISQFIKQYPWIRIIFFAIVISCAIGLNMIFTTESELLGHIQSFGYTGLFFTSVLSGFNLIVPIPIIAFYPTLIAAGFIPVWTIITISAGMVFGDLMGYLLGMSAQGTETAKKWEKRVVSLEDKHPALLPLFVFTYAAVVPLPNELIVVPLAALRTPISMIFIPVLVGNVIFNSLVAFGVMGIVG